MIERAPVAVFVAIAFAISWTIWSPLVLDDPLRGHRAAWFLYYLGVIGPTAAAFLCSFFGAPDSPSMLMRRLVRWRVSIVWYVVAIVLPFVVRAIAVAVTMIVQHDPRPILLRPVEDLARLTMLMLLLVPFEEIGWRGYALPVLQKRYTPLMSSMILGGIWALWHLPLAWSAVGYQQSDRPWAYMLRFFVTILPVSCLATWLFNRTGESVPLVSLFHVSVNMADYSLLLPEQIGSAVLMSTTIIGAVVVAFLWRRDRLGAPTNNY